MTKPDFDKRDQLEQIQSGLLPGEVLHAVFDAIGSGTGFIGVTDRRVILQDNSFAGKKSALTSVPYSRVNAVSFVSNKSMFGKFVSTSEIAVSAGGNVYEVEFRGHDKAKYVHDKILGAITTQG